MEGAAWHDIAPKSRNVMQLNFHDHAPTGTIIQFSQTSSHGHGGEPGRNFNLRTPTVKAAAAVVNRLQHERVYSDWHQGRRALYLQLCPPSSFCDARVCIIIDIATASSGRLVLSLDQNSRALVHMYIFTP
eukprot:scaffold21033_cov18-Tisochrysis_lutea.AAC.3